MRASRLWVVLVPLALVALVLLARRRAEWSADTAEERELVDEHPPVEMATVDANEPRRESGPSSSTPQLELGSRVLVRSSIGLPLERVELELDERTWAFVMLSDRMLDVPLDRRPVRVRARGHRAAALGRDAGELVLYPHTSLVLTSSPLSHLALADPFDSWPNQRDRGEAFLLSGPCDEATWAIAFDASQLRALIPHLEVAFHLDDGTEARVTHTLEPGRYDVYGWPRAPLDAETRMLYLDVERSSQLGALVVGVHARPDSTARPAGSRALFNQELEWGRFVLYDYLELFTDRFEQAPFEIGPLVLGKRYLITVRDEESGDHERLTFVHDGSPVRLRLSGGLRLRGRIDVSPELPPAQLDRIVWSFGSEPDSSFWHGEPTEIALGPDGGFSIALPDQVALADRATFPRPDALELQLRAGGFGMRSLRLDTAGQREIDLGTVRLEALASQFLLASGHGLAASDLADSGVRVADVATSSTLFFSVDGARPREDGSLAIALTASEDADRFRAGGPTSEHTRPWPRPDALVLLSNGENVPFRLGSDELYHREACATFHLRVEATLAPGSPSLALLWEWEGISAWIRNWPAQAFEQPQTVDFDAPSRGARLRWCVGKEPVDAHPPVPLTANEIVLMVP